MTRHGLILMAFSLALAAAPGHWSSTLWAAEKQSPGPTTRAPENLLRVNLVELTGPLRDEATRLDQEIRQALDQLSAASNPGYQEFEETFGALRRYDRIGSELRALGEPTGRDIQLRVSNYRKTLMELGEKYATTGTSEQRAVEKRMEKLPRMIGTTAKKISRATKLAEAKKWREAYESLNRITDPAQEMGFWHEILERRAHPTLASWRKTSQGWFYYLAKELNEEAKGLCREVTGQQGDGTKLIERIQSYAAALATTPTADAGGGAGLAGPQAIEHFGKAWIEHQRQVMRAYGHATILTFLGDGTAVGPVLAQHADFSGKIGPALVGIIQADAERASPEEAETLYLAYLERLPPLIARGNQAALISLFQPALDQLAARSPGFRAEIEAYRLATTDLLRWRRRTAAAHLRAQAETYPSLQSLLRANTKKRGTSALLTADRDGRTRALLIKPIPECMEEARADFMDKLVSVPALHFRKNYGLGIVGERAVGYVSTSPALTRAAWESLAGDLFVSDELPPLNLVAAVALYTAKQGDLSAAGGAIYHIGLTSIPARYVAQTSDDRGLVRLGPLVAPPAAWQIQDLALMFAVRPSWLAHEYFFVELPEY